MFLPLLETSPVCPLLPNTAATYQPIGELLQFPKRRQTDLFEIFKHFEDNSWPEWNARERGQFIGLIVSKIERIEGTLTPNTAIWRMKMLQRLIENEEWLQDSDRGLDAFSCRSSVDTQQRQEFRQESVRLSSSVDSTDTVATESVCMTLIVFPQLRCANT